ncbi:glycosyltransferase family 2 protein [Chryseobacterium sp.]|uniref:glycosyltransferase family 2 protein n=1 Tax=Chryseobacterium sp. TaxID=1871047 RepID=UPI002FC6A3AA
MKLSIIIVTYNSSSLIKTCLQSVFKFNDIGDQLEVIIVDNNSGDFNELSEIVTKEFSNVKLISNAENKGYGQGNNVGVRNSTGDTILIMNPDVILFKPIFNSILSTFTANPETLLIGMKQYETTNKLGQSFLMLNSSPIDLFIHKICKKIDFYSSKMFCFSGACFAISKDAFTKVGMFDENIFLYSEERDLHYRLLKLNGTIIYKKDLGYIHPVEDRGFNVTSIIRAMKSLIYVNEKSGRSKDVTIQNELNIYKVLKLKARLLGRKNEVDQLDLVIQGIKNMN